MTRGAVRPGSRPPRPRSGRGATVDRRPAHGSRADAEAPRRTGSSPGTRAQIIHKAEAGATGKP
ncbi:hypothetical protein SUDANB121_02459 [Nocardiopsis dassonvillei]